MIVPIGPLPFTGSILNFLKMNGMNTPVTIEEIVATNIEIPKINEIELSKNGIVTKIVMPPKRIAIRNTIENCLKK